MDQVKFAKIKKIIEEQVRPVLRADGGDLELLSLSDDGVVHVRMFGACAGCPSAQFTLSDVVEATLRAEMPDIKEVTAEFQVSDDLIQEALKMIREGGPKDTKDQSPKKSDGASGN